jgi:hypothetical protein
MSAAATHAAPAQLTGQRRSADTDDGRGLLDRLAGDIELDRVLKARRVDWAGYVFNLVTAAGWYIANGIVTHNCGCTLEPIEEPVTVTDPAPPGVAVHQHGELGPTLDDPAHAFTPKVDI